jgi:hypothetical protein
VSQFDGSIEAVDAIRRNVREAMRAWRIMLIVIALAMAVGLGISLNGYFHARAEAGALQTQLSELQAANEMTLAENQEAAAALERTAEQLAEAQAAQQDAQQAQQAALDESRQTAAELAQTANELEDLQAAHEETLEEYRSTVKTLQATIAELTGVQTASATTGSTDLATSGNTADNQGTSNSDPSFAQTLGTNGASICAGSNLTASEREQIECWATTLVWRHLGRPRYAELTVTKVYDSALENVWYILGRFACVGSSASPFAATIKLLPNDEWRLLAFSWSATEPGGSIPRAPAGGCCAPLPLTP